METIKKVNETKKVNNKKVNQVLKNSFVELNDEALLNLDLDNVNIEELLKSNKSLNVPLAKKKDIKDSIYKKDAQKENESDKNFRQRIRKQRNMHLDAILDAKKENNTKVLKDSFEAFNSFYKSIYSLNDFSMESITRKNADKNTLMKIKLVFHIIKTELLTK